MAISIIISNFNGRRYLDRLLETLLGQRKVVTEIIIVDRHSTDGSLEYLAQFPDIRVVSEPPASGLVSGYAAGVKVARYDHFFFSNEDMWFDPMCLSRLLEHICLERRIGAADPWQWTYDGKIWIHGGTRFRRRLWDPNSPYPRRGFNFTVPLAAGDRVPFPCAGAFLIHRRMYEDIGGWDTSFFLDQEDVDLFIRAWQRDWHCVTVPEAKIYHAVGASNPQAANKGELIGKRRYISCRSNSTIVALKYFSVPALAWAAGVFLAPMVNNVARLRWKRIRWEMETAMITFRRLKSVWRFRRGNRQYNGVKPGELFFLQPEMADLDTPPGLRRDETLAARP